MKTYVIKDTIKGARALHGMLLDLETSSGVSRADRRSITDARQCLQVALGRVKHLAKAIPSVSDTSLADNLADAIEHLQVRSDEAERVAREWGRL